MYKAIGIYRTVVLVVTTLVVLVVDPTVSDLPPTLGTDDHAVVLAPEGTTHLAYRIDSVSVDTPCVRVDSLYVCPVQIPFTRVDSFYAP